jgi:hypothetical protein
MQFTDDTAFGLNIVIYGANHPISAVILNDLTLKCQMTADMKRELRAKYWYKSHGPTVNIMTGLAQNDWPICIGAMIKNPTLLITSLPPIQNTQSPFDRKKQLKAPGIAAAAIVCGYFSGEMMPQFDEIARKQLNVCGAATMTWHEIYLRLIALNMRTIHTLTLRSAKYTPWLQSFTQLSRDVNPQLVEAIINQFPAAFLYWHEFSLGALLTNNNAPNTADDMIIDIICGILAFPNTSAYHKLIYEKLAMYRYVDHFCGGDHNLDRCTSPICKIAILIMRKYPYYLDLFFGSGARVENVSNVLKAFFNISLRDNPHYPAPRTNINVAVTALKYCPELIRYLPKQYYMMMTVADFADVFYNYPLRDNPLANHLEFLLTYMHMAHANSLQVDKYRRLIELCETGIDIYNPAHFQIPDAAMNDFINILAQSALINSNVLGLLVPQTSIIILTAIGAANHHKIDCAGRIIWRIKKMHKELSLALSMKSRDDIDMICPSGMEIDMLMQDYSNITNTILRYVIHPADD